jgi:hypothetical protein
VPTSGQIARLQVHVEGAIGRGVDEFILDLTTTETHVRKVYRDMTCAEKYVVLGAFIVMVTAAFPEEIRSQLKRAGITLL